MKTTLEAVSGGHVAPARYVSPVGAMGKQFLRLHMSFAYVMIAGLVPVHYISPAVNFLSTVCERRSLRMPYRMLMSAVSNSVVRHDKAIIVSVYLHKTVYNFLSPSKLTVKRNTYDI